MKNKRYQKELNEFEYENEHTPFSLGTLSVMFFCIVMLVVVTFTQINISHFWFANVNDKLTIISKQYPYIAQIPFVIFIAAILGMRYSVVTLIFYTLIGLLWMPIFGLGGGIGYIKTYFFGYILGYFPCAILTAFFLRKFQNSYKGVLFATLTGVLSAHLMGIIYFLILLIFRQFDFLFITEIFSASYWTKFLYDLIISFFAILISFPVKKILWIAMRYEGMRKNHPKTEKQNSGENKV